MASQISLLDNLLETPKPLTVSQFTAQLRRLLETRFAEVWIEGEISNFTRHTSGHWYFTLKDDGAALKCAAFRGHNRYIRFRPENGLSVRIRGRVSVYEPKGEYQVSVTAMEPVGLGALQLAFEQLKEKLGAEGLFSADRKRRLPVLPRRIGIVTSPTGAALHDILRVLRRRNRSVSVLIAPVRVQGETAAREIVGALRALDQQDIDVVIVARGGGSLEDLWAFNDERVARAIVVSRVPVISAVGHEVDFTICDFVADLRAATPSASAEIVAPAAEEVRAWLQARRHAAATGGKLAILRSRSATRALRHSPVMRDVQQAVFRKSQMVDQLSTELVDLASALARDKRERLANRISALAITDPRRRILEARSVVAGLVARSLSAVRSSVDSRREKTAMTAGTLSSLSPLGVLARGFAIVRNSRGEIVRDSSQVEIGELVKIRVESGEFAARREQGED